MELKYLKKYQIDRQFAPLPSGFPPSHGPVELINLNSGPKCITGSLKMYASMLAMRKDVRNSWQSGYLHVKLFFKMLALWNHDVKNEHHTRGRIVCDVTKQHHSNWHIQQVKLIVYWMPHIINQWLCKANNGIWKKEKYPPPQHWHCKKCKSLITQKMSFST